MAFTSDEAKLADQLILWNQEINYSALSDIELGWYGIKLFLGNY